MFKSRLPIGQSLWSRGFPRTITAPGRDGSNHLAVSLCADNSDGGALRDPLGFGDYVNPLVTENTRARRPKVRGRDALDTYEIGPRFGGLVAYGPIGPSAKEYPRLKQSVALG